MSEQQGGEGLRPDPGKSIHIRLPNGTEQSLSEYMQRRSENGEKEMKTSLLKVGDLVVFHLMDDKEEGNDFLVFKVGKNEWTGLGLNNGYCPSPHLAGELEGDSLPDEVNGKTAIFAGSGFGTGGSLRQPDLLAAGRPPYFFFPGKGEFHAPPISDFTIFRKDENGETHRLSHEQVESESRKDILNHRERLVKIDQLMKMFGFANYDFKDGSKSSDISRYEDEKYYASYRAGMAMGNVLAVFDKKAKQWIEFKYYNFMNDDFLQTSFADLSGLSDIDIERAFLNARLIVYETGIMGSGRPVATFSTSDRYGTNLTTYKPSKEDSQKVLNVPLPEAHYTFQPNVQLWPSGEVKIEKEIGVGYQETLAKEPGLLQRLEKAVKFKVSENNTISLDLNGKNIQLKNPDDEIDRLLKYMKGKKKPAESVAKLRGILRSLLHKKKST